MTCLPPEQVLSLSGCFAFLLQKGFLQNQLAADFQLSYSVTEGHSKGIFIEQRLTCVRQDAGELDPSIRELW